MTYKIKKLNEFITRVFTVTNFSRYYDHYRDEMSSDPGRARSRTYARGRSSDDRRDDSDRPRQSSSRPGPSDSATYSRGSTSSGGYPVRLLRIFYQFAALARFLNQ